jgi:hypothetical protein
MLSMTYRETLLQRINIANKAMEEEAAIADRKIQRTSDPDRLAELYKQYATRVARYERLGADARGELERCEMMISNQTSPKPIEWFTEPSRTISTNVATTCVAAAVVHAERGVALAHYDTNTIEARVTNTIRGRSDLRFIRQMHSAADREARQRIMLTDDTRRAVLDYTIAEAHRAFVGLSTEQLPTAGTHIVLCGIYYLAPDDIASLNDFARVCIDNHFTTPSSYVLTSFLGVAGEILYGGPNHELYSSPTIRPLESIR